MRAKEFVQRSVRENKIVNIPISITIPSDEKEPVIVQQNNVAPQGNDTVEPAGPTNVQLTKAEPIVPAPDEIEEPEVQDNLPDEENGDPAADKMIPPLQQELELEKSDAGKDSEIIDQLTQDEDDFDEERNAPLAYR